MKERRQPRVRSFKKLAKAAEFHGDKGCCGIIAIAAATGRSFGRAKAAAERHGREHGKGTPLPAIDKALSDFGFSMTQIEASGTIGKFAEKNPEGVFLLLNAGGRHITCVREGALVDWAAEAPKKRITMAWKVEVKA